MVLGALACFMLYVGSNRDFENSASLPPAGLEERRHGNRIVLTMFDTSSVQSTVHCPRCLALYVPLHLSRVIIVDKKVSGERAKGSE